MNKKIIFIFVAIITVIALTFYLKNFNDTANVERKADNKSPKNTSSKLTNLKPVEEYLWNDTNYAGPISTYLEDLRNEVDKENPSAIYHMAFLQRKCSSVPDTEESLNQSLSKMKNLVSQEIFVKAFDFCEGFPRKELSQEDIKEYILRAARLGDTKAKLEFSAFAFQGFTNENILENTDLISDLKQEAIQHLFDVKRTGERSALMQLGMAYQDGSLIEQNYVEAYANYYAFKEVSPNSSGALLDMIEENLTEEELNLAIIRGKKYAECCN